MAKEKVNKDEAVEEATTPFSAKELEHFRGLILDKRSSAHEDVERMRGQLEDAREQAENDTAYSFHMADAGTDAMEREKTFMQAQRTSDYVKKLDEALIRIQHKTFGICRICGLRLDSRRLMAVPVTQVCTVYKNTSKPCMPGKEFLAHFGEEEE